MRQQYLSAVPRGHQSLDETESEVTEIFIIMRLSFTRVDSHAHFKGNLVPVFSLQFSLSIYGCMEAIVWSTECRAKAIPDHLKYITVVGSNCFAQNGIMSGVQRFPLFWMLLCQFGTSFNIGV